MKIYQYCLLATTLLLPAAVLPISSLGQEPAAIAAAAPVASTASPVQLPGPVHEALVPMSTPAVEVSTRSTRQPPVEQPLLAKPTQTFADAVWVEGYWDWSPYRREFVWVPGTWRRIPPGLSWQPGKWVPAPDGAVRYPGYLFATAASPQIVRTAPPEDGEYAKDGGRMATQKMVGEDAVWVRGSWELDAQGNYLWTPGFVAGVEPGRVWQPGRIVPIAGAYAVVPGYWDYPLAQRGPAFAALRQPIDPQLPPALVDLQSLARGPDGRWNYTRLSTGNTVDVAPEVAIAAQAELYPRRLERGLLVDGSGTIMGIVRKGKLTPEYIQVKLMGGAALVTESDENGRFVFDDIPYGSYTLFAEGPVQNYARQGAAFVDVEQPTVEVEIELE